MSSVNSDGIRGDGVVILKRTDFFRGVIDINGRDEFCGGSSIIELSTSKGDKEKKKEKKRTTNLIHWSLSGMVT